MDNAITNWEAGMTAPADGNAGAGDVGASFGEIPRPDEAYGAQNPRFADSARNDGDSEGENGGLGPLRSRRERRREALWTGAGVVLRGQWRCELR